MGGENARIGTVGGAGSSFIATRATTYVTIRRGERSKAKGQ